MQDAVIKDVAERCGVVADQIKVVNIIEGSIHATFEVSTGETMVDRVGSRLNALRDSSNSGMLSIAGCPVKAITLTLTLTLTQTLA